MKFFLDTEFHEDGKTIELISIALVPEEGENLYLISNEFDPEACNDWVKEHVLPKLAPRDTWKSRAEIRDEILRYVQSFGETPEFWAYYADYDWVVLCQLFGRMVDLPKGWPMFCRDLKQYQEHVGGPPLPKQDPKGEHDALADALWCRDAFNELTSRK